MFAPRMSAQRDANEGDVITALEEHGCLVQPISENGVPDLLVWSPWLKAIVLLEVKDGAKPPSRRRLRPEQERFHLAWRGAGAPVWKVETPAEALIAVGFKNGTPVGGQREK